MTKEKYMALADFQTLWTNTLKPYIVAGFIALTAVAEGATPQLVLQNGSLIAQSTFVAATEKGANSGVATLDATGKVPASQLPSFVDDVIDLLDIAATAPATCAKGDLYYNSDSKKIFEATAADTWAETGTDPEGGKIYITLDDNKTYRWSGTTMAEISAGLALGETQGTAYEGSKGAQLASDLSTHTSNGDLHVTTQNKSDWNAKYDKPSGGIPSTDMTAEVQESLALADTAIQSHQDISGKADKVDSATNGNFAGLDSNGNLTDSGSKPADFATAAQGGKADTAIQSVKVNGTALTPDSNKAVDVEIPERVSASDLATFVV